MPRRDTRCRKGVISLSLEFDGRDLRDLCAPGVTTDRRAAFRYGVTMDRKKNKPATKAGPASSRRTLVKRCRKVSVMVCPSSEGVYRKRDSKVVKV
jgi:hypothetical protein